MNVTVHNKGDDMMGETMNVTVHNKGNDIMGETGSHVVGTAIMSSLWSHCWQAVFVQNHFLAVT